MNLKVVTRRESSKFTLKPPRESWNLRSRTDKKYVLQQILPHVWLHVSTVEDVEELLVQTQDVLGGPKTTDGFHNWGEQILLHRTPVFSKFNL